MSAPSLPRVSTRATAAALDILEQWGVPLDRVVEGLRYDLPYLRSTRQRIPWDDFVQFMVRVREEIGWERLPDLGRALAQAPSWEFPRRFARLVVSPRLFLLGAVQFFGPAVFPAIDSRVRELSDGSCELLLEIPTGRRACPEFFHVSHAHIASCTTLLGLPEARVVAEIDDRWARYLITPPASATLLARVGRTARSLVRGPTALRELVSQQEELRRDSQEVGRASRELFALLAALPVGVCLHRNGVVVYGNEALARAMGYSDAQEMVGESILGHAHPEDRPAVAERIAAAEAEAPVPPAELRFVRTDGSTVVLEVTPIPPVHFGGVLTRVVVARDLTDQKRIQQQLVLSDRMASIGTLAAGVAHEVNNPLTWLRSSLDIVQLQLERLVEGGVSPDRLAIVRDALAAAVEGTDRVATIVGDLRTLSRPVDEPLEPVAVTDVLASALRIAEKELRQRARVVREYAEVPPVEAAPGRLGQVFLNLLVNAAQAIREGAPDDNAITVRVSARDGRVAVEVSDTGPGIAPELLSRIFDPFFTTKPGVGTGLGLPISHAIVTSMGGELEVESELGRGTTMRVVLPASGRPRRAADSVSRPSV